jgi:ferredoxin-NADP reductase
MALTKWAHQAILQARHEQTEHPDRLSVRHWNDSLFSFKVTRDAGLRFENGQFVMIGLEVEGRP